jgi:hypothetical protein
VFSLLLLLMFSSIVRKLVERSIDSEASDSVATESGGGGGGGAARLRRSLDSDDTAPAAVAIVDACGGGGGVQGRVTRVLAALSLPLPPPLLLLQRLSWPATLFVRTTVAERTSCPPSLSCLGGVSVTATSACALAASSVAVFDATHEPSAITAVSRTP